MDVGSWLRGLGLGQIAAAFEDNAKLVCRNLA